MGGNVGLTISVCIQQEAILNTVVKEGLTVYVVRSFMWLFRVIFLKAERWRHSCQEYLGNRDSVEGPWYGYAGLYRSGLAHSASPQRPWPDDSPREFIKHTGPWRFWSTSNWQGGHVHVEDPRIIGYMQRCLLPTPFQALSPQWTWARNILFTSTPGDFYQASLKNRFS